MVEIMLDFIQCHHCGERFGMNDRMEDHWYTCPNSPAREAYETMKDLLLKIRNELLTEYWSIQVVELVKEIDALLGDEANR